MRSNLPDKNIFIGQVVPDYGDYVIKEYIDSGFNAHIFKAYSKDLNNNVACKIIPKANLGFSKDKISLWKQEAQKANTLENESVVKINHSFEWSDPFKGIDCVGFCSEYVNGVSLRKYLLRHKNEVTISFIVSVLRTLLGLLYETTKKGIQHEDLHAGNVLIDLGSEYQIEPAIKVRITDFGIGTTSTAESNDDFENVARILKDLLENVNYQALESEDRFCYNILNEHFLARHLIEKDITLDPLARNPKELYKKLSSIDKEYATRISQKENIYLATPFDYLSCEQIGEAHSLLKALYSELFLGLQDIEGRNNLVLTGPRGCGKSTVFKSLSLKHILRVQADNKKFKYFGIYYRCDDLYFAFPRYKIPEREEALDLPLHFLTSTLLRQLLEDLIGWAIQDFKEEFYRKQNRIAAAIWSELKIPKPEEPNVDSLLLIIRYLAKERNHAVEKHRFAHDKKQQFTRPLFGPDILPKICSILTQELSFIKDKPFYFFIDDYSLPKITGDLQRNLNRLLMQRTSSCFFKLSTESPVSYVSADIDGKKYPEGREFVLHDLGQIYLSAPSDTKLLFIEDVFKRRFDAVTDYPVKGIEELIGTLSNYNQNEFARQIRDGKKIEWCGKETLCDLCSGDIHYIIRLVGKMVSDYGGPDKVKSTEVPRIPPSIQNKAIRDQAGSFLSSLRGTFKEGSQLVDIATAFGNVSHSYLKYRNSKNEKGIPPYQAARIEPYEEMNLGDDAQKIFTELLRYSVFIVDNRGKSRRGKVVPRLHLRRFLIPHFNLTFSGRDSIQLEPQDLEELLLNPKSFENKMRLKSVIKNDDEIKIENDPNQTALDLQI